MIMMLMTVIDDDDDVYNYNPTQYYILNDDLIHTTDNELFFELYLIRSFNHLTILYIWEWFLSLTYLM